MSLISVIIPTYNHAQYVAHAVDSALAQSYPDVEVVVVDDGSIDQTRALLSKYEGQINYIYQENRGLSAARNTGIRAAHGDGLLFLDADDTIPPNKLAIQVPCLEAGPQLGLVYSGWRYTSQDGTQLLAEVRPGLQGNLVKEMLRREFFFPVSAAIVRKECFDRVGLFDESLRAAEDTDMWLRIARAGYAFEYVDELLFDYRVVKGSMSSRHDNQTRNEFAVLDKFFADPDLPQDIKQVREKAYGILHFESAAKYYQVGDMDRGQHHIREAIADCPSLSTNREWLLEWLSGCVLGPAVDQPHRLIDLIIDNLPPEATLLRSLRRRAHGRYHIAASFSEYRNHHMRKVRRHILPALMGDPAIVRNRGFIRIALQSLFGSSRA